MRILFLTHYFWPEGNAPATRVRELTRRWAAAGDDVTVVTGVPNVPDGVPYPGYRNRLVSRETVDGVRVVRVWTFLAPNRGVVRRSLNYWSFMKTAGTAALFVARPDVVIATSPQFFCGWAGAFAAWARRRPFVLEIRDLWPESIRTVGALRAGPLLRALSWLERRLYASADRIVTVGDGYRRQLVARGVAPERISVIPNGVDLAAFAPREPPADVRRRYGIEGAFVCAYAGTIGLACGLDVVLRAARLLRARGRRDVRFLLAGDGAVRADLERQAREAGLAEIVFTGRLGKEEMPGILAASDACLVHLRKKELFQTVLPSKIFEAAAMARPVILGVEGDAAALVRAAGAGLCIEPENETQLAEAVERLAAQPELAREFGRNGRERIAPRFDFDHLASEYRALLERVCGNASGGR